MFWYKMPQYKPGCVWFLRFCFFFWFWDRIHILTDRVLCRLANYSIFIPMTSLLFYLVVIPWQQDGRLQALCTAAKMMFRCKKGSRFAHVCNIHLQKKRWRYRQSAQEIGWKVQGPYQDSHKIKGPRPCTCASDDSTHDFFCPHTGTSNIAPAEDTGIMMPCDGKSTTPTGNTLTCGTTLACLFCLPGQQDCLACIM